MKFSFHFSLNDSNFRKPIAVQEVRRGVDESPSPNTYNLSGVHTGKNTAITAESAFKSRSADLGCGQLTWGVVSDFGCVITKKNLNVQSLHPVLLSTCKPPFFE